MTYMYFWYGIKNSLFLKQGSVFWTYPSHSTWTGGNIQCLQENVEESPGMSTLRHSADLKKTFRIWSHKVCSKNFLCCSLPRISQVAKQFHSSFDNKWWSLSSLIELSNMENRELNEKCTCWSALSAVPLQRFFGPYVFEDNDKTAVMVTAKPYHQMVELFFKTTYCWWPRDVVATIRGHSSHC